MKQTGGGADSGALVFVYGSLKRDMTNHGQMQQARWIGTAQLEGLELYDLGPFPMAIVSNDAKAAINGELFRVTRNHLKKLDQFEGTPRLYQRQRWPLHDGGWSWVYLGQARQVRHVNRIVSGSWPGPADNFRRLGKPQANDPAQPTPGPDPKR